MKFRAINRNSEFIRGYRKGVCSVHSGVVVYLVNKKGGGTRIGITSSKKIGGAVRRSRARRVIRAAVRDLNLDMSRNVDLIFVARSRTPSLKSYQVADMISRALAETGYYDV